MVIREKLYSVEEFREIADLPENEDRRLELEDEVIVEMPGSRPVNGATESCINHFLCGFVIPNNLGTVFTLDVDFRLGAGRARRPDVAFVSLERAPVLPEHFDIAPDLAVEVVSPNEDVLRKVSEYLEAGTKLVWVVYPAEKTVHIFQSIEPRWRTLTVGDVLEGESVLPGFQLPVADIFPTNFPQ